jgi:hypothetical protein
MKTETTNETDRLSEGAAREAAKMNKDELCATLASACHDLIAEAYGRKPADAWTPLFQAHAIVRAIEILHATQGEPNKATNTNA